MVRKMITPSRRSVTTSNEWAVRSDSPQLTDSARQIYAATYGDPPDPPATTALIEILASPP
jgi:hypothetical protein